MPISPTAIREFLETCPPPPPRFRGAARDQLLADIHRVGGEDLLTRTDPYQHQLEGLAFALWAERALLFYEMRTGKTKLALDYISYLIYSSLLTRKALVIAHAPIGVDEWEHQAKRHSHLDVVAIRSGGNYTAEEFFYTLHHAPCHVVLIAWSTLQVIFNAPGTVRTGSKKGQPKLYANRPLLRDAAALFDCVVIDEIHMAGHDTSLRFAIASELVARSRWRLGLTGTPFGRDPLLVWAQAALIDSGNALGRKFAFFREAFCTTKYNRFKKYNNLDYVFDRQKLPVMRDKLAALALHCELKDVQEVNVLKGVVQLTMSPEQAKAYDDAVARLVQVAIGNTVEIDNTFIRLRQIASGFLPFTDNDGNTRLVEFPDAAKVNWLDDFVENLPDLQLVIFHEFIRTGEWICRVLDKHKVKYDWLHGGTTERPALLERFRSGRTQVLVANTATGGMAIDLSAADYLLFFESTASVIVRRQAEARPLARGARPLVIDDLVCAPIEQKMLDFLAQGEGLRDALLRDPRRMADELRR